MGLIGNEIRNPFNIYAESKHPNNEIYINLHVLALEDLENFDFLKIEGIIFEDESENEVVLRLICRFSKTNATIGLKFVHNRVLI